MISSTLRVASRYRSRHTMWGCSRSPSSSTVKRHCTPSPPDQLPRPHSQTQVWRRCNNTSGPLWKAIACSAVTPWGFPSVEQGRYHIRDHRSVRLYISDSPCLAGADTQRCILFSLVSGPQLPFATPRWTSIVTIIYIPTAVRSVAGAGRRWDKGPD